MGVKERLAMLEQDTVRPVFMAWQDRGETAEQAEQKARAAQGFGDDAECLLIRWRNPGGQHGA